MSVWRRMVRREVGSGIRWLLMFSVLLGLTCAVPVLAGAESPGTSTAGVFEPPQEGPSEWTPDAAEVQAGLEAAEEEEEARERELRSPTAAVERQDSLLAFGDVDRQEAQDLLRRIFAEKLGALNSDPARALTDADRVRPLSKTAAIVTEDGDGALLDAGIPVRVQDEDGDLESVDLSLDREAGSFETVNAISDVRIGGTAAGAIEVGESGISITQSGASTASVSAPFGEQNVFHFESQTDTDTLVSPTSSGVEVFNLLRSEESPETFRFKIGLPEGTELRPDGQGGAVVVHENETLASIPFPTAVDAQGTNVPVELSIEGDTLSLHVAHREGDYAMPILLDPILEDWVNSYSNWQNGHNLQALSNGAWQGWSPNWQIYLSTSCMYACWGSGRGLFVSAPSGNYGAGVAAHWYYPAPNLGSYISKAWLIPFWRDDHNCSRWQYQQPYDYDGLWDHLYNGGHWNALQTNQAIDVGSIALESWGRAFVFGLSSGGGVNIPCWRDLYVGGAAIWLDDWEYPYVNSVTGAPSGWISDTTPVNVSINGGDSGLGVYRATITPEGKGPISQVVGCTGLHGSRCPTSYSMPFNLSGLNFGEGIRINWTSFEDPTGKAGGGVYFHTKVDRTPPEVILSGQLAQATNEGGPSEQPPGVGDELSLPVYNLSIAATDGSNSSDLTRRSGVKNIEVALDGVKQTVPWGPQTATEDSLPMSKTYELKLSGLSTAGKHTLEVKAIDQVGNLRERKIEFEYFPATGMKDEYVMHYFPLPDGSGNEAEEEHPDRPELAVNVMNGNLVYREQDVEVEGPAVDLEVERYYNSMLPTAENTEWGDGWTLSQTPDLTPLKTGGSSVPNEAEILEFSGALDGGIRLPTQTGASKFDPSLQATVTKKPTGGYELTDETGESPVSVSFSASGRTEALLTEGYAKVDYAYQGGELSEIVVKDPASAGNPTEAPPEEGNFEPESQAPRYVKSFGSYGEGPGEFASARGVAMDPQGNLWIADTYNNRVQKYGPGGNFLRQVEVFMPSDVAVDPQGNAWISAPYYGSIIKISSEGIFLDEVTAGGGLSYPTGIAIDGAGSIWLADTGNNRVVELDSNGEILSSFGSEGSEAGQLAGPEGIAVDSNDHVWVADTYNSRIQKFSSEGSFLLQATGGEGGFGNPMAIAVDTEEGVWVADTYNGRIQHLNAQGEYLEQFGTSGTNPGEFGYPMGIEADAGGHIWISDTENGRIQKWTTSAPPPDAAYFVGEFGSKGSEPGQLSNPSSVAADSEGDLWVSDTANNRLQQLGAEGEPIRQVGSTGSGNGQFSSPRGIAISPSGSVWVVDTGNNRIQEFDSEGKFIRAVGSSGSGQGQFKSPHDLAVDANGNVWVTDPGNFRVQKFSASGQFISAFGSQGSGNGQFFAATGIAVDREGDVWVADSINRRIQEFTSQGAFIRKVGSSGSGQGQFYAPTDLVSDQDGNIWVADSSNDRIQGFDAAGTYLTMFGTSGANANQFKSPVGIGADAEGNLWVADSETNSIKRWWPYRKSPEQEAELLPPEDDPRVDVELSAGLVESVDGEEAGQHTYAHTSDDLTSHAGPQGTSSYEYDAAGRMTKVTLANGSWASITYEAFLGRVKTVTVDPAGAEPAKKTEFEYTDAPTRRTVVIPPDAPHVTYDIGEDGSVLRWWNSLQPPVFDDLAGSLYAGRGKEDGLLAGDHYLDIQAHSEEGIASIQVIANGNQLVHETPCEQTEAPGIECKTVVSEWVTNSELHAPGHLNVEVLATDRLGQASSERFWVDIPEPPPPPAPGTPIPPKFSEILKFRQDYGLEIVFPVATEIERNERIFNLINAWYQGDAVARASWERWGVPLRPADVAEIEYREWFMEQNIPLVEDWANQHRPSTFAGYYIDHRGGGIMHIGFTSDQPGALAELKEQIPVAAADRLAIYPVIPTVSRTSLDGTLVNVEALWDNDPALAETIVSSGIDESTNTVEVTGRNVSLIEDHIKNALGQQAPLSVRYEDEGSEFAGRNHVSGRILAGDRLVFQKAIGASYCTAGFGAWDRVGIKSNGEPVIIPFALTAGHCAPVGRLFYRQNSGGAIVLDPRWKIGHSARTGLPHDQQEYQTDGSAIALNASGLMPYHIFINDYNSKPVGPAYAPRTGETLCFSGVASNARKCGEFVGVRRREGQGPGKQLFLVTRFAGIPGDSGAPVWSPRTGRAVGLVSGGPNGTGLVKDWVAPLVVPRRQDPKKVPGILNAPGMKSLHLAVPGG
jgi:tripartite motif-containing protein 71